MNIPGVTMAKGKGNSQKKFKGFTRKNNTGNINKSNKPKSSGGGGGGKKGKKGKSGKAKEKIEKEKSQKDIYHDINKEISHLTNNLEKLQKVQETTTDPDKIVKNLEKQIQAIRDLNEAYKEKIAIAKEEAKRQQGELNKDYGANFDEATGDITNYDEIYDGLYQKYSDAVDAYNKSKTDKNKEAIDKAKEELENFTKDLGEYEGTQDLLKEVQQSIRDGLKNIIKNEIEKITVQVEAEVDFVAGRQKWYEFKRKFVDNLTDDNLLGSLQVAYEEVFDYIGSEFTESSIEKLYGLMNQMAGEYSMGLGGDGNSILIQSFDGMTEEDLKAGREALEKTYDELISQMEGLYDAAEQVQDAYLESIDGIIDARDALTESYELFNNQLEHDIKMIELVNGEDAYDKLGEKYIKQVDLVEQRYQNAYSNMQYYAEKYNAALASGNKEEIEKWQSALQSAIDDTNSMMEAWGDALLTKYENIIDGLVDKMDRALTNGLTAEWTKEAYDLALDNEDDYLDAVNSAYAMEKLRREWLGVIDDASSLNVQTELNDAMNEQLKMLERKGDLTQHDIDRAELELEIVKKRNALQDAQQSKTKMRLRRDANGNYSYQFVSDEEANRQAMQELADAQNQLYNFDKDAVKDNLEQIASTIQDYQSKVAEIYKTYGKDSEEAVQRISVLTEEYNKKVNTLTNQNAQYRSELISSALDEMKNYYGMTDDIIANMDASQKQLMMQGLIGPSWASPLQDLAENLSNGGFAQAATQMITSANAALNEYTAGLSNLELLNNSVSADVNTLAETIQATARINLDEAEAVYKTAAEIYDEIANRLLEYTEFLKQVTEAMGKVSELLYGVDNRIKGDEMLQRYEENLAETVGASANGAISNSTSTSITNSATTTQDVINSQAQAYSTAFDDLGTILESIDKHMAKVDHFFDYTRLSDVLKEKVFSDIARMSNIDTNIQTIKDVVTNNELKQNVTINAEFPNATSSSEIENAFNNLLLNTSQYMLSDNF